MTSLEPVVGGGAVTGQRIGHGGAVGVRGVVRRSCSLVGRGRCVVGRSRGIVGRSRSVVGRGGLLVGRGGGTVLLGRGTVGVDNRGAVAGLVSGLVRAGASQKKVGEDGG